MRAGVLETYAAAAAAEDARLADFHTVERADLEWARAAHDAQRAPVGGWATWVFLGGRGAGKTRAGAEWLAGRAARTERSALVGPTLHDVREVMIGGPSGLAWLPRWAASGAERPRFEPSRRRLLFDNGAVAYAFSAEDPDSLRGPQFGAAWADEFCAWTRPEGTMAMLRLGLRLGAGPRAVVTTTPRPTGALRRLLAEPGTVRTDAGTAVNAANLSPGFLAGLQALYGGTRLAAQELEGLVTEAEGALFRMADIAAGRGEAPPRSALERVLVGVDPPAAGGVCGVVAAGRLGDVAWVLDDRSEGGLTPAQWAARVRETAERWDAGLVVAEANQGGEMVREVLRGSGLSTPVRLVNARWGKRGRAEPVAALYEQGRVRHGGTFRALEEELTALGGEGEAGVKADRADALVWAMTELLLSPERGPRARFV